MNKLLISTTLFICLFSEQTLSANQLGYVPPLAAEAKIMPGKFPEEIENEKYEAERVRYSVLIGRRDYDALEKEAGQIIQRYVDKKISGDEFISQIFVIVPLKSGKLQIIGVRVRS